MKPVFVQHLQIERLYGKSKILVAAKHNLREITAEYENNPMSHIDPKRSHLNKILRGASIANDISKTAKLLMTNANIKKLRKDAVIGIEAVVSLPNEINFKSDPFFEDSIEWLSEYFKAPILSAIIHNDESNPHMHILILPLINGRMTGSDLHGGRAKLMVMQEGFYRAVGQRYGLVRQIAHRRYSKAVRDDAIELAYNVLAPICGFKDEILRFLIDRHRTDPEPLVKILGKDMPNAKSVKTFVEIMTKPCKPEKHIGFSKPLVAQMEEIDAPKEVQTISCVGFAASENTTSNDSSANQDFVVRIRDEENLACLWNAELGEFENGRLINLNEPFIRD